MWHIGWQGEWGSTPVSCPYFLYFNVLHQVEFVDKNNFEAPNPRRVTSIPSVSAGLWRAGWRPWSALHLKSSTPCWSALCLAATLLWHRPFLGQYGTNATPPASKDSVFNCSELLRLKEMRASGAPSRMARSSTGKHFCQSELQGTVENRSLRAGGVAFDILRCWKDDHLQTSEYSLQVKYRGELTNTTENGSTAKWLQMVEDWLQKKYNAWLQPNNKNVWFYWKQRRQRKWDEMNICIK